jgi:alkyl hydroperoxide reductase 1
MFLSFFLSFLLLVYNAIDQWLIDQQLFLSDPGTSFSKKIGWTKGERTARYALVIDDGKILYAEKEPGREITVSSAEAVLTKL